MKLRNKKTGEIGYTAVLRSKAIMIMDKNAIKLAEYTSLSKLSEDWEDYEEPKLFYVVDLDGEIIPSDFEDKTIEKAKELGNYFETKEEAEKAVEKLKAWKRLKDKGFRFHGHNALGVGEITFSLDFEDMDDEGEIGQLRHDLDLLFGGEE